MKPPPSWCAKRTWRPAILPSIRSRSARGYAPGSRGSCTSRSGYGVGPGGIAGRGGQPDIVAIPPTPDTPASRHLTPVATGTYDPLLGRTYAEIGDDARSNHKCQGMGGLSATPRRRQAAAAERPAAVGGRLPADGNHPAGREGQAGNLALRRHRYQPRPRSRSMPGRIRRRRSPPALAAIADRCPARADSLRRSSNDAARRRRWKPASRRVRALRAQLARMGLSDSARYEIDFRLQAQGARLRGRRAGRARPQRSTRWPTTAW